MGPGGDQEGRSRDLCAKTRLRTVRKPQSKRPPRLTRTRRGSAEGGTGEEAPTGPAEQDPKAGAPPLPFPQDCPVFRPGPPSPWFPTHRRLRHPHSLRPTPSASLHRPDPHKPGPGARPAAAPFGRKASRTRLIGPSSPRGTSCPGISAQGPAPFQADATPPPDVAGSPAQVQGPHPPSKLGIQWETAVNGHPRALLSRC